MFGDVQESFLIHKGSRVSPIKQIVMYRWPGALTELGLGRIKLG